MKTQIVSLNGLVGKTISAQIKSHYGDQILFVFNDGTFAVLHARGGHDDDSSVEIGAWRGVLDLAHEFVKSDLYQYEIITAGEFVDAETARHQLDKAQREKVERQNYERLRKKFEEKA